MLELRYFKESSRFSWKVNINLKVKVNIKLKEPRELTKKSTRKIWEWSEVAGYINLKNK